MDTVVGPVELVVLAFPGSQFNGQIVPAVADLVNRGVVSILDFAVVTKTDSGEVTAVEVEELDDGVRKVFAQLTGEVTGLLSEADLTVAASSLDPGSSAVVMVWENTWARTLVRAIRGSGGILVTHERLDAATVTGAVAALNQEP